MLKIVVLALFALHASAEVQKAIVSLKSGTIEGTITFEKSGDAVKISGVVNGLPKGNHGFHIHEKGDLGDGCKAAGGHFNPSKKDHGAPGDENRHVGDLGNIVADEKQVAKVDFSDKIIALSGDNSIIGRALVIHEGEDDLGKGGFNDSKTTGHAGNRLVCGVIGIEDSSAGSVITTSFFLLISGLYLTVINLIKFS